MYSWGKELTLETAESSRYTLVATEDEGPMTIGSPPVLLDVIELFRSTLACEKPDVETEGPRDNVTFSTSIQRATKELTSRSRKESGFLQDGESV